MKCTFLLLLALTTMSVLGARQVSSSATIRARERDLLRAMRTKSERRFSRLLAPHFEMVDTDGMKSDRKKTLADFRNLVRKRKRVFFSSKLKSVTVHGPSAIVQSESTFEGGGFRVMTSEQKTWTRIGGEWRLKLVKTVRGEAWHNGEFYPFPGGPAGSRGWLGISPVRLIK